MACAVARLAEALPRRRGRCGRGARRAHGITLARDVGSTRSPAPAADDPPPRRGSCTCPPSRLAVRRAVAGRRPSCAGWRTVPAVAGLAGQVRVASAPALLRRSSRASARQALELLIPDRRSTATALDFLTAPLCRAPCRGSRHLRGARRGHRHLRAAYRFPRASSSTAISRVDPLLRRHQPAHHAAIQELFLHPVRETVRTTGADPRARLLAAADAAVTPPDPRAARAGGARRGFLRRRGAGAGVPAHLAPIPIPARRRALADLESRRGDRGAGVELDDAASFRAAPRGPPSPSSRRRIPVPRRARALVASGAQRLEVELLDVLGEEEIPRCASRWSRTPRWPPS